jgi:hypothetical protein
MRFAGRAPVVVPGADGAVVLPPPACVACGSTTAARGVEGVSLLALMLCDDAAACARRYRLGTSPESYAAGLRGEILAVAP